MIPPSMRQNKPIVAKFLPAIDLLLVLIFAYYSPWIADLIGPSLGWKKVGGFNIFETTPFVAGAAVGAVPFVLSLCGFYLRGNLQRVSTALRQIATFTAYYLCAIAFYQSRQPHPDVMNHVIMVNMVGIPILLFIRFILFYYLLTYTLLGKRQLRQPLLIGERQVIEQYWQQMPHSWTRTMKAPCFAYTGEVTPEEVQGMIEEKHVSQAILFGGLDAYQVNEKVIGLCELQGIDIYVQLSSDHSVRLRAGIDSIGEQRMLILSSAPEYSLSYMIKNLADKVLAAFIILLSSPLWVIAAIGIKRSDPNGPVFYRQQRSGLYGKPFGMWKFRSMYSDAEERLNEIKAKFGNEVDGPIFKLTNDPRVIPFGNFLRKSSIDELPQLINVLMGDMSIVGPRPLPLYETAEFPEIGNRRRLSVKPGLTCYWQVEDRSNATEFTVMVEKDLKYIDNWSLWLDVKLFFRTIPAVLLRRGAK